MAELQRRRIEKLEALIREEANAHYCAWCGGHNTEMGHPHERGCPAAKLLPDLVSWSKWQKYMKTRAAAEEGS